MDTVGLVDPTVLSGRSGPTFWRLPADSLECEALLTHSCFLPSPAFQDQSLSAAGAEADRFHHAIFGEAFLV